ncbi:MAG: cupin domain-containing protein [Christensenellales bacterium]
MLEKLYSFSIDDEKHIEKIIDDDPVLINHMVLPKGEGLAEHYSNSNVYMIIVRGAMTLKLNEQEPQLYTGGRIVRIPYKTKMNVNNYDDAVLEFFVVKAPNPRHYKED